MREAGTKRCSLGGRQRCDDGVTAVVQRAKGLAVCVFKFALIDHDA